MLTIPYPSDNLASLDMIKGVWTRDIYLYPMDLPAVSHNACTRNSDSLMSDPVKLKKDSKIRAYL